MTNRQLEKFVSTLPQSIRLSFLKCPAARQCRVYLLHCHDGAFDFVDFIHPPPHAAGPDCIDVLSVIGLLHLLGGNWYFGSVHL